MGISDEDYARALEQKQKELLKAYKEMKEKQKGATITLGNATNATWATREPLGVKTITEKDLVA